MVYKESYSYSESIYQLWFAFGFLGILNCKECFGRGTDAKVSIDCKEEDCIISSECNQKTPATIICGKKDLL